MTTKTEAGKTDEGRRSFLKLATVAAPAVAVATVAATDEAEAAVETQGEGLRKTEHVKKYLETARF